MPITAPDPKVIECFLSTHTQPGEAVMHAVWQTTFKFASRKGWLFTGGWAQHVFLREKDAALYDESKTCTSGDFDVYSTDPLQDLVELGQILQRQTGMQVQTSAGMKPNVFHASFNFGGASIADCVYMPASVQKCVPQRIVPTPHGNIRVTDPTFELSRLYHLVSNMFLLGKEMNLQKRFARIRLLEQHTAIDTNSKKNANANANANAARPNAKTQGFLSEVAQTCVGHRAAVVVGLGAYRALRGWAFVNMSDTVELAVHDTLFAEVLEKLLSCVRKHFHGATVWVRLHATFLLAAPYSCWVDVEADGRTVARLYCAITPIPCASADSSKLITASCFFQLAHLYWTHLYCKCSGHFDLLPKLAAAFTHTQKMYIAATQDDGSVTPDLLGYTIDDAHFAGSMPFVHSHSLWHRRRATGALPSVRISSDKSINPNVMSNMKKQCYNIFDGREVAALEASQLPNAAAITRFVWQHMPVQLHAPSGR
jgi:hypothetical protein